MKCGTSATSTFLRQHSRLYDMGTFKFNATALGCRCDFLEGTDKKYRLKKAKHTTLIVITIVVSSFMSNLRETIATGRFCLKRRLLITKTQRFLNAFDK